ncbi:unnamed protein product [Clonostachys rosea]|uniref:Hydrophobin n=1 Tax=Bionectria ochroleuca TaxID=29856 RepID=A0ABY6U4C0_BIOOC|nr:unnamed protein product [Clonostachys rosea]
MKHLIVALLSTVVIVAAKGYEACPHSGKLLCCNSDLLNLAYLRCFKPDPTPKSAEDLESICGEERADPKCCSLKVASIGTLCSDAEGFHNGHLNGNRNRYVRQSDEDSLPGTEASIGSDEPNPDDILKSDSPLYEEGDNVEDFDDDTPDITSLFDESEFSNHDEGDSIASDDASQPSKPDESENSEDIDDIISGIANLYEEDES